MKQIMVIDYRNPDGTFSRKVIDNMEFCVRDGIAYFISGGTTYQIEVEAISQVYLI